MEDIKNLEPLWGNWYIKELLGEGGYGKVYRIERNEYGVKYEAALKHISIPQSKSEIKNILMSGMDEKSITTYFEGFIEEMVKEFALMSKLKGDSHIVSYEDHQILKSDKELHWDIFIRMELLTSLVDYVTENKITKRDIIKLGIDICKALETCQKYNIIHRDIKPENIFISNTGKFKLGDFGIARQIEKTVSGLSKKGTYTYIAPEVYKGEAYGSSVDIYSLGLVMYRFLNNNRMPFMPPYPQPISFQDQEMSLAYRISGKELPTPTDGSGRLAEIVIKACSYNPKDRYSSPADMRRDLEAILYNEAESKLIYPQGDNVDVKSVEYVSDIIKVDDSPQDDFKTVELSYEDDNVDETMTMAVPKEDDLDLTKTMALSEENDIYSTVAIMDPQEDLAATKTMAFSEETDFDATRTMAFSQEVNYKDTSTESLKQKAYNSKNDLNINSSHLTDYNNIFSNSNGDNNNDEFENAMERIRNGKIKKLKIGTGVIVASVVLFIIVNIAFNKDSSSVYKNSYSSNNGYSSTDSGVDYNLTNGILTISGIGAMEDYNFFDGSYPPWYGRDAEIKEIVIEDGVTHIGDWAFGHCENLTNLTIADSVETIGHDAFVFCHSLISVVIPDSVTSIGDFAFGDCEKLVDVKLPDSTIIGRGVFGSCEDYSIKNGNFTISGDGPMYNYNVSSFRDDIRTGLNKEEAPWEDIKGDIVSAEIDYGITHLGNEAFKNCINLLTVTIANTVEEIGYEAFCDCISLININIPDGVEYIDTRAFYGCTNLVDVHIGSGVKEIGSEAFYGCSSLTSVIIPEGVTTIEDAAFANCTNLSTVIIPNSVTSIGQNAFSGCNIANVTIPNSSTILEAYAFDDKTSVIRQ